MSLSLGSHLLLYFVLLRHARWMPDPRVLIFQAWVRSPSPLPLSFFVYIIPSRLDLGERGLRKVHMFC
jgi:hypothetical protein